MNESKQNAVLQTAVIGVTGYAGAELARLLLRKLISGAIGASLDIC